MQIEKIKFDDKTYIWKTKLNLDVYKNEFLKKSKKIIDSKPDVPTDGYPYFLRFKNQIDSFEKWRCGEGRVFISNSMDNVAQLGIDVCSNLYLENMKEWNRVNLEIWINRVQSKKPVQTGFFSENRDERFHTHTDICDRRKMFYPHFTWIYYIQMPDIIRDNTDDAVLYFKNEDGIEYSILPKEDELIILPGYMPHLPMNAPESTIDRIVLAGNVGFEMIKTSKTLF